ncbi:hypothetical protein [Parafrankia discariae]|uniref:hypothetical protein n=1 Tax=Parafrankia discariae TaxID=365528 RepID=UPI0003AA42ED|nr:hypothetical protein [Parafrankia discariae]
MGHGPVGRGPVSRDLVSRGAAWAGGFVVVTHGLVHLLVWPGAPLGTGDAGGGGAGSGDAGGGGTGGGARLRWNGDSWSWQPEWLPALVVRSVGAALLTGTVLGCVLCGLALLGLPGVRRFPLRAGTVGAVCSLALFALVWPGLEPDPAEFVAGPVLSGVLLAGVGIAAFLRRRARRSTGDAPPAGTPAGADAPTADVPTADAPTAGTPAGGG